MQENFADNNGHNILRLFDTLRNFVLTTSETERDYSNKHGIYKLPHELPNNFRLWILGSKEISGKSQNFIEF